MRIEFSNDEMILALVGMVRRVNPRMLRETEEGFTLDFESLDTRDKLTGDEALLLKLRAAMEPPAEAGAPEAPPAARGMELSAEEGARLGEALVSLEKMGTWPADVLSLSRGIRKRLAAIR